MIRILINPSSNLTAGKSGSGYSLLKPEKSAVLPVTCMRALLFLSGRH